MFRSRLLPVVFAPAAVLVVGAVSLSRVHAQTLGGTPEQSAHVIYKGSAILWQVEKITIK